MPAFLYDYCRQGEYSPLKIGDGVVMPTDRQTQAHLLCDDCEDILNRGGETWIADKLATMERAFPLYDLLAQKAPQWDEEGTALYLAANNPAIRADKITHFALGMFWKASVHSWSGTETEPRIELGLYSEMIRKWLRGESGFPNFVYLNVFVSRPLNAQISMLDPFQKSREEWRTFLALVPGLAFMLCVGKTVDESLRALCIQNGQRNPVSVSDGITELLEKLLVRKFQSVRKTDAFLRTKAKRDEERKNHPDP